MTKFKFSLKDNQALNSITSSIISIVIGMIVGLIIVIFINPSRAFEAYGSFITYGFSTTTNIVGFIYRAAPYLMTGLAVAFCFNAGTFNIGGPGQFIVGGVCAYLSAVMLQMPWYVSLLLAILGSGLYGMLPGLLKAHFNVNEVLSAIMLNWISLISMNWIFDSLNLFDKGVTKKVNLLNTNPNAMLPTLGLENLDSHFTIALFLGIIIAIAIWITLNKTSLGFSIKAVGLNKDAAKYAGIPEKRTLITTFTIGGILAGLGGAFYMLLPPGSNQGFSNTYTDLNAVGGMGFDGISVALLANNNPIGCIFSALFISYIKLSGSGLNPYFSKYVGDTVIGVIVYLASFIALIKILLAKGYLTSWIAKFKDFITRRQNKLATVNYNPIEDNQIQNVEENVQKEVNQTPQEITPLNEQVEENKKEETSESISISQDEELVQEETPIEQSKEETEVEEEKEIVEQVQDNNLNEEVKNETPSIKEEKPLEEPIKEEPSKVEEVPSKEEKKINATKVSKKKAETKKKADIDKSSSKKKEKTKKDASKKESKKKDKPKEDASKEEPKKKAPKRKQKSILDNVTYTSSKKKVNKKGKEEK